MSMFDLTEDELVEAKSGGFPSFKDGGVYTFLLEEYKDNAEKERIEVKYKITSDHEKGKTGTHFFFYKNKKNWINFLGTFFTEQEMLAGGIASRIHEIIGESIVSTCKKSEWQGKTYDNFYEYKRKSDVPEDLMEAAEESVANIPAQQEEGATVF